MKSIRILFLLALLISVNQGSHAWVIDGCYDKTITTTVTSHYCYYHPGYSYPPNATYLTESEVLSLYPNAYDGFSVVEYRQHRQT